VQKTLIDAGPCIALFDRDDRYHNQVKKLMQAFRGRLVTSWPVVTEVSHMLDFDQRVQVDFVRWLERGAVEIAALSREDLPGIITLTEQYADRPMDLADATLLIIADREKIDDILSIDSDFSIYRTARGRVLNNLIASI
jgi:uncharacterized protein